MSDRIRVGVVGVGWGTVVIVPAFRAVPEFEVVALCSRREASVAAAGEKLGITDTSTDWERFVKRDDLDLVVIATPTDLHRDQVLAAVAAGKNVLCEKPVALDAKQAREMLDAAESAGVLHATDFEGRWLPDRLAMWDLARSGFLGQPYLGRVATTVDLWHPSHHLQNEWMYQREAGGGYLMGASSHDIDYLSALFGPPVAVCAEVHTSVKERTREDGTTFPVTADDTSTVLLRFADGVVGSTSCTVMGLGVDRRHTELFGSDGAIEIDTTLLKGDAGPLRLTTARPGEERQQVAPSSRDVRSGIEIPSRRAGGAIRAMALMLEDWLPAFNGQPTPGVPTLYDGLVTASVVDAAQRSAAGEGWVPLDL